MALGIRWLALPDPDPTRSPDPNGARRDDQRGRRRCVGVVIAMVRRLEVYRGDVVEAGRPKACQCRVRGQGEHERGSGLGLGLGFGSNRCEETVPAMSRSPVTLSIGMAVDRAVMCRGKDGCIVVIT